MKGFGHAQNSQRTYEAKILASNEQKNVLLIHLCGDNKNCFGIKQK